MNELPAPPEAAGDAAAVEVLRAWIVGEALQCSLQADAFPDPGSWGAVLADVARYVARARHEQEGIPEEQTVQRILEVFHEEIRSSTTQ
jgi:hypothetical protein